MTAAVLSALASLAAVALYAAKFITDFRRRKNRAMVTFVKGYALAPNGRRHQYRAVRVANDGERPIAVEQIGFYAGKRRDIFMPVDAGNDSPSPSAYKGKVLAPGESLTVIVNQDVCAALATGETFQAFCRLADDEEFTSKPFSESPAAVACLV